MAVCNWLPTSLFMSQAGLAAAFFLSLNVAVLESPCREPNGTIHERSKIRVTTVMEFFNDPDGKRWTFQNLCIFPNGDEVVIGTLSDTVCRKKDPTKSPKTPDNAYCNRNGARVFYYVDRYADIRLNGCKVYGEWSAGSRRLRSYYSDDYPPVHEKETESVTVDGRPIDLKTKHIRIARGTRPELRYCVQLRMNSDNLSTAAVSIRTNAYYHGKGCVSMYLHGRVQDFGMGIVLEANELLGTCKRILEHKYILLGDDSFPNLDQ